MNISLQTLVSVGSLIGVIIAVYRVYKMKESTMRAEGATAQEQITFKLELKAAKDRINDLEAKLRQTDLNYAGFEADMKTVMKALDRIEGKLDKHIAGDVKEL